MFECVYCDYATNIKGNFSRHLKTSKHQKLALVSPKLALVSPKLAFLDKNDKLTLRCKFCDKIFKHKSSLSRHIKLNCSKKQNMQTELIVKDMKNEIVELTNKNEKLAKMNEKLKKSQVTNNHNHNHGVINNNIILNNYIDTDISHLTDLDYVHIINQVNLSIPKFIEKVHFDPQKPENMNVYISNMKDKFIMMYKDGNWKLNDRNIEINHMLDLNMVTLSSWIENNNKYKSLKKKFELLERNLEDKDIEKFIKDEIKLVLYNNRGLLVGSTKT
jgi:uncharacterized C2H2 Zn-finger protein